MTWQHISPDVSVKGFKKCYISIGMEWECEEWVWGRWRHQLWTWRQ